MKFLKLSLEAAAMPAAGMTNCMQSKYRAKPICIIATTEATYQWIKANIDGDMAICNFQRRLFSGVLAGRQMAC